MNFISHKSGCLCHEVFFFLFGRNFFRSKIIGDIFIEKVFSGLCILICIFTFLQPWLKFNIGTYSESLLLKQAACNQNVCMCVWRTSTLLIKANKPSFLVQCLHGDQRPPLQTPHWNIVTSHQIVNSKECLLMF